SLSDHGEITLDHVRAAAHAGEVDTLQLHVDLGCLEDGRGERVTTQPDQRVGVVALPQLDALLFGKPDRRERNRSRGTGSTIGSDLSHRRSLPATSAMAPRNDS